VFNEAHKKFAENKELAKGRAVIDQENRDPKEVDPRFCNDLFNRS